MDCNTALSGCRARAIPHIEGVSPKPLERGSVECLHKGWFDDSLPRWLEANEGPVAFIHNDSDLYLSAVTIFELLAPRMQRGTIILFDEFFNYPGWKIHQAKAWRELSEKHKVDFTFIGYARQQVGLRINSVGSE